MHTLAREGSWPANREVNQEEEDSADADSCGRSQNWAPESARSGRISEMAPKSRTARFVFLTALGVLALLALQGGAGLASAQTAIGSATGQPTRTIHVSGDGQVSIQPDIAVVTLGVQTDATTAGEAMSQNSRQAQAVIDALKQAGVAARDIQTQQIQLQPRYQTVQPANSQTGGEPELVGYTAINTVQVRVRDLSKVGQLLDAAVASGGNRIQGIAFEVSDSSAALDLARTAAWDNAQQKAEQLARLAGGQLGAVLTVDESSQTPVPFVQASPALARAAAVPIEPGAQTLTVHLDVTWLLSGGE
jgi:uncharacterized protein YggE